MPSVWSCKIRIKYDKACTMGNKDMQPVGQRPEVLEVQKGMLEKINLKGFLTRKRPFSDAELKKKSRGCPWLNVLGQGDI